MKRTYFIKMRVDYKKKLLKLWRRKNFVGLFIHFNRGDFQLAHTKPSTQRNLSQENSIKTIEANKLQRKEPITISSIAIQFHIVHILWIHTVPTPVYVCAHKYFRKNCCRCYVRRFVRSMNFSSLYARLFFRSVSIAHRCECETVDGIRFMEVHHKK